MSDSSEEEININRKDLHLGRKRLLKDLFEEEEHEASEETISSVDYEDRESLFFEIFGTGEEYRYVLESEDQEQTEEMEEVSIPHEDTVNADEVYEYAMNNMKIDRDSLRKIVEHLHKGHSIHFALLHGGVEGVGIEEGYKVVDIFDEYRGFIALRDEMRRRYGDDELLQAIGSIRPLRWYSAYKKHLGKNLNVPDEILSAEDFCENIRKKKKIHEPKASSSFLDFAGEEELVRRISLHPIFRNALYTIFKTHGVRDAERGLRIDEGVVRRDLVEFCLSDISSDGPWNRCRERVIRDSVERAGREVIIPLVLKEMEEEELKKKVFEEAVDRVVNGSSGVLGDGSYVCGVTEEKKYLKAAVVNFSGDMVDCITVREGDKDELLKFLKRFTPCRVAVSGFSTSIRYLMKTLSSWSPVYVENKVARIKGEDAHAFCCNMARIIQCPEIEYSNMVERGIIYVEDESLPRDTAAEMMKRGILTAASIVGVDINILLNNKRKAGLLSLLPISRTTKDSLSDIRYVMKLEDLQDLCKDEVEYNNLVTYLRIYPGVLSRVSGAEILDSTSVHPRHYAIARKLCARLCNEENAEETSLDPVRKVLDNDKELLRRLEPKKSSLAGPGDEMAVDIYNMLESSDRPVYAGLPDHLVFKDLTGCNENLAGKVVEGRVSKCGGTFYLVDSASTPATIYVRRDRGDPELFLNQLVTVKIEYVNDFLLSYTGRIATPEQKRPQHSRFVTHPLFRDLNSNESEKYLDSHSLSLLLRRSRKDGSPVMVLKISDDIYVHMKIQEAEKYHYKGGTYDDLDEFVSRMAKKILMNVRNIKNHRYYFEDEGKLLDYLTQGGNYIRYGFYLSRKYPGKLCMLYRNGSDHKEYITVEDSLLYNGRSFGTLDEFIRYRKSL